jgi:hypothetical protein
MTSQKKPTGMTDVLGDFVSGILKDVIAGIIVNILYKHAKKWLKWAWVIPFLVKLRLRIALLLHLFALELHIEDFSTFFVSIFVLAYKSATKEQKATFRQILFSDNAPIR